MKKECYTIMILDDMPASTLFLQRLLGKIGYVEVVHIVDNPEQGLSLLDIRPVDILILDMEMPAMMGWEFVNLLDDPPVILVFTAHAQYGFKAQEIGARGYISKTLNYNLLKKAIDDAIREVDYRDELTKNNSTHVKVRNFDTKRDEIIVHEDLYYAEVDDKIVSLYLKEGRVIHSQMSLSKLMDELPDNKFVRISAKHMVGKHAVMSCSRKEVQVRICESILEILYPNAYVKLQYMLDGDV